MNKASNRREFLVALVRIGVLGVLSWACARLARRALNHPQACTSQGRCGRCGLARTCSLPRAERYRSEPAQEHDRA